MHVSSELYEKCVRVIESSTTLEQYDVAREYMMLCSRHLHYVWIESLLEIYGEHKQELFRKWIC